MKCKELILEQLKERLRKLYPLENQEELLQSLIKKWCLQLLGVLGIILLVIVLMIATGKEENILEDGNMVSRPSYNEAGTEVKLKAEIKAEGVEPEELILQVEPEKYTFSEFEAVVKEAIPELEVLILGENISSDEIVEDLNLPEMLLDTPIEIVWESDNEEIIARTGKLNKDAEITEDRIVTLTAGFVYNNYKMSHVMAVRVKYKELTEQERLKRSLYSEIEEVFLTSEEDEKIKLPEEVEGKAIIYEEKKPDSRKGIFFFLMGGVLLWVIALKEELEGLEKKREKQLLMDYPALISQFTLLLSAGMTVSGAWKRLIGQYEKQVQDGTKKRRYVYDEMIITWREMQNGISEIDAINRFGARIRLVPYLKFAALLSQNLRKGSRGLLSLLRVEGKLAYEERKEMAKQLGEEAGTRLLVPMFMMFGIVLVVILVPAFSSF